MWQWISLNTEEHRDLAPKLPSAGSGPSGPLNNGSNLVVIPSLRTYTGGRSPRSWVQLHAEQPHPALRQLASPTRGQRMLCESQPPVSCAEAKAHNLSARALLLEAATVAQRPAAPISSSARISYSRPTLSSLSTLPHARKRSIFSRILWLLPCGRHASASSAR